MAGDFRGPAAKGFDWVHIVDRHSDIGVTATQRTSKKHTVFTGLSEDALRARVKGAWKKRSRVETQTDPSGIVRIRYQGTDTRSGQVVEFWFNEATQRVETAYPAGDQP